MPELPEVETIRRQLQGALPGRTVQAVKKTEPSMLRGIGPEAFVSELPGSRILAVHRTGKFLIVELAGELYLTLHLGMTGQILLHAAWREAGSHDRFVLRLAEADPVESLTGRQVAQSGESPPSRDGVETGSEPTFVVFRDIRKFGRVELTRGAPAARVAGLGPDAWLGEWDAAYLNARLSGRKAPLKAFLLDQRHLAGIGNIYADEILFAAGLSPLRQAGALTYAESERLANVIRERLSEGVRARGCSISDFVDTKERRGSFQEVLRAYGRAGEACVQCGGRLVRTVVAGRGTSHCPVCQT